MNLYHFRMIWHLIVWLHFTASKQPVSDNIYKTTFTRRANTQVNITMLTHVISFVPGSNLSPSLVFSDFSLTDDAAVVMSLTLDRQVNSHMFRSIYGGYILSLPLTVFARSVSYKLNAQVLLKLQQVPLSFPFTIGVNYLALHNVNIEACNQKELYKHPHIPTHLLLAFIHVSHLIT